MTPEQNLWQQVVLQAFRDATSNFNEGGISENARAKREAIFWITHGGYDFHLTCTNAGFDPDFLREAFLAGRVNGEALRAAQKT